MALQAICEKRLDDAELLLNQAIDEMERWYGPSHTAVATVIQDLATFHCYCDEEECDLTKIEKLFRRVLHIRETKLGKSHLGVAETLLELGRSSEPRSLVCVLMRLKAWLKNLILPPAGMYFEIASCAWIVRGLCVTARVLVCSIIIFAETSLFLPLFRLCILLKLRVVFASDLALILSKYCLFIPHDFAENCV